MIDSKEQPADPDAEVVKRAFEGDPSAFRAVVERYQRPVINLCRRYVAWEDAEDVAQDTFVRAFVHRARFDASRPLLPWLLTIARRLCIDRGRSMKRASMGALDLEQEEDGTEPADIVAARNEALSVVAASLDDLPEGQREAVLLCHVEGLSYSEMAEVLGVPIGTVMTWLHRGRGRLKERYLNATGKRRLKRLEGES